MSLITENDARKMIAEGIIKEKGKLHIEKGSILTPSAKEYLTQKNITIYHEQVGRAKMSMDTDYIVEFSKESDTDEKEKYDTVFGIKLEEKPENMTHLRGNYLVFKDNKRIVFRGKIDSLESKIILVQTLAQKENKTKLVDDLEEIITFIRNILRCEVSGEKLEDFKLQELSHEQLREHSHHPSKYYGVKHFLPTYKHGELVANLNELRTKTREVELAAFEAFKEDNSMNENINIIRGLNRLSSLFWIMMFKMLNKEYDKKAK